MKRNSLILLAILLAALFSACSDSDDNNNDNPKGGIHNPIDVKLTPEYAALGVENYEISYSLLEKERLAGDVKTAHMMVHSIIKWNETEKETFVSGRNEVTFNKNGLLEKEEFFSIDNKNTKLLLESSTNEYDKHNRKVYADRKYYSENASLSSGMIYEFTYDDVNNKVTVVVSKIGKTGVTTPLDKHVSNLDYYGHLGTSEVTEIFYPKATYQSGKALSRAQPNSVSSEIFKIARDHKNNILSAYLLQDGEDAPYSYYTQEFSYHDGSKSVAGAVKDELEGGGFVAKTLAAKNLVGNVKTMIHNTYRNSENKWDEQKKEIIWSGTKTSQEEFDYNSQGYLIGHKKHDQLTSNIYDQYAYKVDAKGRITEEKQDNEWVVYTISYDDAKKEATQLMYTPEKNVHAKHIYKLAADGTISLANKEWYSLISSNSSSKNTKAAASAESQFEETPSTIQRRYEKKDAKGNIIEYGLITINNKTNKSAVLESYTRTITYY